MRASWLIAGLLILAAFLFALGLINALIPMDPPPTYIPEPTSTTR